MSLITTTHFGIDHFDARDNSQRHCSSAQFSTVDISITVSVSLFRWLADAILPDSRSKYFFWYSMINLLHCMMVAPLYSVWYLTICSPSWNWYDEKKSVRPRTFLIWSFAQTKWLRTIPNTGILIFQCVNLQQMSSVVCLLWIDALCAWAGESPPVFGRYSIYISIRSG